jgi:hypothetical protein
MNQTPGVTYFAETDSRNKRVPFGIKTADRSRHTYLIGKTGMGKSTVLENMAIQDIQNGNGLAFIDPHGKTADLFLEYIPEERIKDVIYFAPFDTDFPISFNVMEDVGADKRHLVVNGLMSAFKKIWVDAWSARMEYILNNTLLALLEYPGSTLIGVNRMFADKEYRKLVVEKVTDSSVKAFWNDEFAKYNDKYAQEATAAIQNKIGQFISNPMVRNIIGQTESTFDFREVMDNKKIVIINLSKGRMGEANANLLGSMIITKIYLAAMSRADKSEKDLDNLPNFYLYVDEFQNFANESFADILSEARKYKLNLTVAHQYIEQMSHEVRAAVFGNVGTMITFRVGAYDAEVLEKEFAPEFTMEDLVNLGRFQIYLKLMIDGVSSSPFSASTLSPIEKPIVSFSKEIIEYSRAHYARPREVVENEIREWHAPIGGGVKNTPPKPSSTPSVSVPTPSPQSTQAQPQVHQPQSPRPKTFPNQTYRRGENEEKTPKTPSVIPLKIHQPFKTAFTFSTPKDVSVEHRDDKETEFRKAISLDYLKPKHEENKLQHHEVKNKKEPTPENLSALKEALLSVIGDVKKDQVNQVRPVTPPPTQIPPQTQPVVQPAKKQPLKEIPEDVLKKMLEL